MRNSFSTLRHLPRWAILDIAFVPPKRLDGPMRTWQSSKVLFAIPVSIRIRYLCIIPRIRTRSAFAKPTTSPSTGNISHIHRTIFLAIAFATTSIRFNMYFYARANTHIRVHMDHHLTSIYLPSSSLSLLFFFFFHSFWKGFYLFLSFFLFFSNGRGLPMLRFLMGMGRAKIVTCTLMDGRRGYIFFVYSVFFFVLYSARVLAIAILVCVLIRMKVGRRREGTGWVEMKWTFIMKKKDNFCVDKKERTFAMIAGRELAAATKRCS
jgi:hypothetical protein